ncbi:MAG: hypothetical protein MUP58_01990 [Candidatus Nanohaloarchaeota archaeon QJJ-9]|nr:hypothetical protein [Candidatus Nanohaloarchaeota archaeon QJJ-9]
MAIKQRFKSDGPIEKIDLEEADEKQVLLYLEDLEQMTHCDGFENKVGDEIDRIESSSIYPKDYKAEYNGARKAVYLGNAKILEITGNDELKVENCSIDLEGGEALVRRKLNPNSYHDLQINPGDYDIKIHTRNKEKEDTITPNYSQLSNGKVAKLFLKPLEGKGMLLQQLSNEKLEVRDQYV